MEMDMKMSLTDLRNAKSPEPRPEMAFSNPTPGKSYRIESKAGYVMGVYHGATPDEAFAEMVAEAGGGVNDAGDPTEGTVDDWIFVEVITD